MPTCSIPSACTRKQRGNDVGVLQEHDQDEVEYAEDRVLDPKSKVIDAFNTLKWAVEEHDVGSDYSATSNNFRERIMTVSVPKNQAHVAEFFERT